MCKGNEAFRGEIERGNSVVLLVTPDERQDEISKGKNQSALDSRLTDRSLARYLSCAYIGDSIYVDGGVCSRKVRPEGSQRHRDQGENGRPRGGRVLRISSDGDDQRIFWGLKFSISSSCTQVKMS